MARIRTPLHKDVIQAKNRIVWLIAIYIRLSREDGNDESLSVTNQKKILMEFLEHEFVGESILVDLYIDDGATGTDHDRPEFQRMLRAIESKEVNCIICKDLSRAFRNYSDQGYFLENYFPLHNIRFITLGSPKIDSYLNPEAIQGLEVPINGLLNDRYAAKTSQDVRRTFHLKRKKGEFIGAFAPFGYQKKEDNKNQLCIDEEAAQIVRNIFHWFVNDGMSKQGIVKRLNEQGIPNPAAYKRNNGQRFNNPSTGKNDGLWNPSTIHRMLLNQMYIGNMVQGKQKIISYKVHDRIATPKDEWYIVENTHEAIIDKETFEKAQSLNNRDTRTAPANREVYLFSGFIRCADCGKAMTRRTAKGHVYYACRTYVSKDKSKCTKHTVKLETLEQVTLVTLQKQIDLIANLSNIIQTIHNTPIQQTQSQNLTQLLKARRQEQNKLQSVKDSLYVDWKTGELSRDDYQRMKNKFEAQIEQLEQAIIHLEEERKLAESGVQSNEPYLAVFLNHKNIVSLERSILVELVEVILVHANGEIEIQFKYADQFQRIMEFVEDNYYKSSAV